MNAFKAFREHSQTLPTEEFREFLDNISTKVKEIQKMIVFEAFREHLETLPTEDFRERFLGPDSFTEALKSKGAIVAGSYPLFFCAEPRPFHAQTQRELLTFALCMQRRNLRLPHNYLLRLGALLQWSEFYNDFRCGNLDADILIGPDREWNPKYQLYTAERGFYVLFPGLFDIAEEYTALTDCYPHYGPGKMQFLLLASNTIRPETFMETSFDLDFCQAWFDGDKLTAYNPTMRGSIRLYKYRSILRDLTVRRHHSGNGQSLTEVEISALQHRLWETIRQRCEKYNRRRFTIVNREEIEEFRGQVQQACGMECVPINWSC